MIKLATLTIGAISLATAIFVAAPALADDPGANPVGDWTCTATGASEAAGLLTMTETTYAFTPANAPSGSGSYRIDRNVLTVTSGPLKDDFGLGHGHFSTRTSPLSLTFDTAAGRGMTCTPQD